eukprot:672397-Prymnesium_polylepis.1
MPYSGVGAHAHVGRAGAREHGDGLARLDRCVGGGVEHLDLVERQARANVDKALGLLHHLDRCEEDARPVCGSHGCIHMGGHMGGHTGGHMGGHMG